MFSFCKKLYASLGQFKILYFISAIGITIFIIWSIYTGEGLACIDTPSYYEAYDVITKGKIDLYRTPLYPLIIGSCRSIFGEIGSVAVVYILQGILFLFSIKWLGDVLMNITAYRRIGYWFTAIYALHPGFLSYCGVMMSESIAISLVAAELYLVCGAYYHHSSRKALLSGAVCLLLCLHRPSLMCLSVLITIFWAIILLFSKRKQKKAMRCGLASSLMSIIFLCIYSVAFHSEYRFKGVSAVSTWNNYMTIRGASAIDIEHIESLAIKDTLDSMLNAHGKGPKMTYEWWEEMEILASRFDMDSVSYMVTAQMKAHPKEIFAFLYRDRINELIEDDCAPLGRAIPHQIMSITRLFRVNNGTAFLIFIVGVILLFYGNLRQKRINYFEWLLFAMFAGNYFTVWVGAPNDFARLLAQNYPVLIAISCWVLSQLTWFASTGASARISENE